MIVFCWKFQIQRHIIFNNFPWKFQKNVKLRKFGFDQHTYRVFLWNDNNRGMTTGVNTSLLKIQITYMYPCPRMYPGNFDHHFHEFLHRLRLPNSVCYTYRCPESPLNLCDELFIFLVDSVQSKCAGECVYINKHLNDAVHFLSPKCYCVRRERLLEADRGRRREVV